MIKVKILPDDLYQITWQPCPVCKQNKQKAEITDGIRYFNECYDCDSLLCHTFADWAVAMANHKEYPVANV